MKTSCDAPVGMPCASTLKAPNWPTGMVPPDQSISLVMDVNVPSSVVMGLAKFVLTTATCHPEPASGLRRTIGCADGNWIFNPTTAAVGDSLGTRKVSTASEVPCGNDEGLTVTCAPAAAAVRRTATRAHAPARPSFLAMLVPLPRTDGGVTARCRRS